MIDEKEADKEIADWFKKAIDNGNHEVDTVDTSAVVRHIIDKQPRVGEWIPCSERLPDKNGSYLVSFKEAITNSDGLCVKYWSGEEQRWRPCNYAPSVNWQAWMPLPPAYKEGE